MTPTECDNCKKPYDPNTQPFGMCQTCNKKVLCPDCYWTHDCVPGKGRRLLIITNPQWICNLRKLVSDQGTP